MFVVPISGFERSDNRPLLTQAKKRGRIDSCGKIKISALRISVFGRLPEG
jgi:hypothetical protein